jgi:hypothetical protein
VIENRDVLLDAGIAPEKASAVLEESQRLCYPE